MKEFYFDVREGLLRGLRPDLRARRNPEALTQLRNMLSLVGGLSRSRVLVNPFTGLTPSFPHPQLLAGQSQVMLADLTTLSTVNVSTFARTQLSTYNYATPASTKSIVSGGVWHFADFGDSWFLHNGSCVVYKTNLEGIRAGTNKVLVQDDLLVNAACAHKGRYVYGGFDSADFTGHVWQTFFDLAKSNMPAGVSGPSGHFECGPATIMWSAAGGGDAAWLYHSDLYLSGLMQYAEDGFEAASRPFLLEWWLRGDMGFLNLPSRTLLQAIVPVGNLLAAFTQDKVFLLGFIQSPMPTLAIVGEWPLAIAGRGGAVAAPGHALALDARGELWSISSDGPSKLGYREFLSSLAASQDLVMSYDFEEGTAYISDGEDCYTFGPNGLGHTDQLVTSIAKIGEDTYCVDTGETLSSQIELTTDTFDMGVPGLKKLTSVQVVTNNVSGIYISVQYRFKASEAFTTGPWVLANNEGVVMVPYTGVDFRVKVKGTATNAYAVVDGVSVRWKYIDRRVTRGAYGGAIQAES